MLEIPVLIVGGGPVGLTASLLLSQHGIQSLLVERHPGTAILPKARGINARTMEMYRQMGIEADIRAAGFPPEYGGMIVWTESLAGKEINRIEPGRNSARNRGVSPATNCGGLPLSRVTNSNRWMWPETIMLTPLGSARFHASSRETESATGGPLA